MELETLDIDKFVEVNSLQQVTGLTFFDASGAPSEDGLFSYSIFGRAGSQERGRRWGYIELNGRFLHPLIYKTCTQLDRKFAEIIAQVRMVRLTKTGQLVDAGDDVDGWTGIDGLYEHWEKINWGEAKPGSQRAERLRVIKVVPRKLAFITKWHVAPAFIRDVDTTSTSAVKEIPPINYLYIQLLTSAPTKVSGLTFADGSRKRRAQETLLELHRSLLELLAGKKGLIQERVLGKYTDWSTRGVLSGPALAKANHPSEQEVPFGYLGTPLYLLINMFQPFVVKRLSEIFSAFSQGQERVLINNGPGKEPTFLELPADARSKLGPDLYKKWISKFMRSQADRIAPLTVTTGRGNEIYIPLYDAVLGRKTTLLDLFFIVGTEVAADKHVVFTRYPVEDFRAPHYARPSILTVERTEVRTIGETVYPRYPVIDEKMMRWVDSYRINNSYTAAQGADFDGPR